MSLYIIYVYVSIYLSVCRSKIISNYDSLSLSLYMYMYIIEKEKERHRHIDISTSHGEEPWSHNGPPQGLEAVARSRQLHLAGVELRPAGRADLARFRPGRAGVGGRRWGAVGNGGPVLGCPSLFVSIGPKRGPYFRRPTMWHNPRTKQPCPAQQLYMPSKSNSPTKQQVGPASLEFVEGALSK